MMRRLGSSMNPGEIKQFLFLLVLNLMGFMPNINYRAQIAIRLQYSGRKDENNPCRNKIIVTDTRNIRSIFVLICV